MIKIFRNLQSHNQKGFSLPEIIIALGILGGVSLMATNLIVDQNSNESYLKARIEIKNMMSFVQESIGNKEKCGSMLGGLALAGDNLSIPLTSLKVPIKTHSGQKKEILKSNTEYKGFKIDGIELYTDQRINSVPASTTGFELIPVRINVDFRIKSKSLFSNSDRIIKETIPFFVTMKSSDRKVTNCEVVFTVTNDTAKEKFCKSLSSAAVWNTTTKRCSFPNLACPPYEVPVTTTSSSNSISTLTCKPTLDVMQLSDLFDTTSSCVSTGTFRIINSSGKLKIDCSTVIDCAGTWSRCDCATGMQTYTITTPASGGGLACPSANNQTQSCTRQYGWVETIYNSPNTTCVSAPTAGPGACTSSNVGANFTDTTCQLRDVNGVWTTVPNCQGPDCTEVDKLNVCKCI